MHTTEYSQCVANLASLLHKMGNKQAELEVRPGRHRRRHGHRHRHRHRQRQRHRHRHRHRHKHTPPPTPLQVLYKHAITIAQTGFGEEHPHTAVCLTNMGGGSCYCYCLADVGGGSCYCYCLIDMGGGSCYCLLLHVTAL